MAEREAEEVLNQSARDASQITSAAKRDAQKLITDAARNIVDYRSWLSSAISEAERLHRAQNSSLNAAEQAIQESRQKLRHAFDRLSQLQADINANLDGESKPTGKVFVQVPAKKLPKLLQENKRLQTAKIRPAKRSLSNS